jgi:zinc/manganese transport system substrate-binding protein
MIYANNIASALIKADPANAEDYRARAELYISEMKKLNGEIRQALATIPMDRRQVVTSHDAFGYFARDYGVQFISAMGISSDAEPSAKGLAELINQVKATHSPAVFLENVSNPKLIKQIARETGAKVGGNLYSDALDQPDQPAGTYLGMFKWNAGQLIYALKPGEDAKP